jgi:hypothetical protein
VWLAPHAMCVTIWCARPGTAISFVNGFFWGKCASNNIGEQRWQVGRAALRSRLRAFEGGNRERREGGGGVQYLVACTEVLEVAEPQLPVLVALLVVGRREHLWAGPRMSMCRSSRA